MSGNDRTPRSEARRRGSRDAGREGKDPGGADAGGSGGGSRSGAGSGSGAGGGWSTVRAGRWGARRTGVGQAGTGQPDPPPNPGWSIVSYLIAGMGFYGGLGWLIGHWTGYTAVLLPVGLLVGLGLALTLIIFRYGRS